MQHGKVFVTTFLLFGALATAQAQDAPAGVRYSAPFTCGSNAAFDRIVPGEYATAVALHNSARQVAPIVARIALAFPPGELTAGAVSEALQLSLDPGTAFEIDCGDIQSEFVFADGAPATPYIQGFVLIESKRRLIVTATLTVADAASGQASGITVQRVTENR